jgi:acyl carrier protein phosphodiesterase
LNFLAHIYLSGENEGILLGNFIADAIKGKKVDLYTGDVHTGIRLHRFIDDFTDTHSIVRRTTARLRSEFGKFSPVVADVFYDHYLAANWLEFHEMDLKTFCDKIYDKLLLLKDEMPKETQIMLPYMIQNNWLLNYAEAEGVNRALQGLSRRTVQGSRMEFGMNELLKNYDLYKQDFFEFFPLLIAASENFIHANQKHH